MAVRSLGWRSRVVMIELSGAPPRRPRYSPSASDTKVARSVPTEMGVLVHGTFIITSSVLFFGGVSGALYP